MSDRFGLGEPCTITVTVIAGDEQLTRFYWFWPQVHQALLSATEVNDA